MKRRQFIAGLGSAVAWPLAARSQQGDRMRRIGVLMGWDNPATKDQLSAFTQVLQGLGWTDGRTVRMEVRWSPGDFDGMRAVAKELVDLRPDVILAHSTPVTAELKRQTRTIPIIMVSVSDPVGDGLIASLARPGGNITGFINTEAEMAGKWVELLAEIAPSLKRVAIMFNPDTAPGGGSYFLPSFEAAAQSRNVTSIAAAVHSDSEIGTVMTLLGRAPGSGLVVMSDAFMSVHQESIISLATENNVPVVGPATLWSREGGLLSYGANQEDLFRRAASYVDRTLRGTTPAELPVQVPTKFEMAVNLKTAKALGLTIPSSILLRADEVIE